jgi:hypothetical protein
MLTNCTFTRNTAILGGGMFNIAFCIPTLINCIFSKNSARLDGGGMYNYGYCDATLVNCTFSKNSAVEQGGGMYNFVSDLTVTNCIFWNDISNEIYDDDSFPVVTSSCIQGGYPGMGNIDLDPLFVDAAGSDLHLFHNSPCRNTGDNAAVTELTDFEGDPRVAYGTVDMGADEFYTHFYCTGDFSPSGSIEGKLTGLPGTSPVGLFLGFGVLDPPVPTAWGSFFLQPPVFLIPLTPIPANGVRALRPAHAGAHRARVGFADESVCARGAVSRERKEQRIHLGHQSAMNAFIMQMSLNRHAVSHLYLVLLFPSVTLLILSTKCQ